MNWRRAAASSALVLTLVGCGVAPARHGSNSPDAERAWQLRRNSLSALQVFSLKARVAESGLSATRGDLSWRQDGDSFEATVSGPLGVGALALRGDSHGVELRTKDGTVTTTEPERYMEEQLGWSLPLPRLRQWVLGLPAVEPERPDPKLLLDDFGRPVEIRQDGWTIDYDDYQDAGSTTLPHKLALTDGRRKFRLVVDAWDGVP